MEPLHRFWRLGAPSEPDRRDGSSARHEHAHPTMNRRISKIMRKVDDLGDHRWIRVNAVEPKHSRIQVEQSQTIIFCQ
jgi:hypothetical protein